VCERPTQSDVFLCIRGGSRAVGSGTSAETDGFSNVQLAVCIATASHTHLCIYNSSGRSPKTDISLNEEEKNDTNENVQTSK
jgi:hypothetical protein